MALIICPSCSSDDIDGTPQPDSRLLIHCNNCGHEWLRGDARRDPARPAVQTAESLRSEFPTAADVRPDVRERVMLLQSEFLLDRPDVVARYGRLARLRAQQAYDWDLVTDTLERVYRRVAR